MQRRAIGAVKIKWKMETRLEKALGGERRGREKEKALSKQNHVSHVSKTKYSSFHEHK